VVARVEKLGDLFAPVLELKQRLPDLKGVASPAVSDAQPTISIAAQADDEPEDTAHRTVKKSGKSPRARKAKRKV
jgi:predicted kinase